MDLANEFIAILIEDGHNAYLQRRKDAAEAGPYRMVDGGRYEPSIEKWTIYRWFPGARMNARKEKLFPLGLVDGIDGIFYFQPEARVKMGDLVHEDTPFERIPRATYRVEDAIPYYFGATCIYIAAHVKKMSPVS